MEILSLTIEVSNDRILEKKAKFNKDWILKKKQRTKLKINVNTTFSPINKCFGSLFQIYLFDFHKNTLVSLK